MLTNGLPDPIWVDKSAALEEMVQDLGRYPIIAVDTESNSLHAYREQVCLIQFSSPETDYLVDPLALQNLSALGAVFENPQIEKVFHAAEYDLICLKRDFGFTFSNLFDTMVAGRILGRSAVGLAAMLEAEFGIVLDKHYQRADWGLRPLKAEMLAYARLDTHYLIPLRDRLLMELKERELVPLALEDFIRACSINGHQSDNHHEEAFWRITGVQDLEPQQLAVLRELCAYRDSQAQAANQPAFKILSNQALLEVAQTRPHYIEELRLLPSLSERNIKRHGRNLLRAVERGLTMQPPRRPTPHRMDDRTALRLEALRTWRKQAGHRMGVESDVILPRELLYELAEQNPTTHEELAQLLQNLPWRYERFGSEILQALRRH